MGRIVSVLLLLNVFIVPISAQRDSTFTEREQKRVSTTESPSVEQPYTVAEEMPEFPGGRDAFLKYVATNIQFPEQAKKDGVTGTIYAKFVIERDGSISNTRIVKGLCEACDREVIRVIASMPRWKPGRQNNRDVRVEYIVPVRFRLD